MMITMTHPLSLYLHIPFCDHRCAYCDFNAYAGLDSLMPAYTDALAAEVRAWAQVIADCGPRHAGAGLRSAEARHGRLANKGTTGADALANLRHPSTGPQSAIRNPQWRVPTVFFGGGTPSLLPLPLLERVITAVREGFTVEPDAEWSLEANPGTVDEAYFRGLHALGVNRVSIGVQSFDDDELRRLDRIHNAATAEAAYRAARTAGFENINLDLIYGLEGQTLDGWRRNVERALALGPEHLSLYALTIEEGTPLAHRVAQGAAPDPDPDVQADMYELAQDRLAAAGYEQYEISNWAKPDHECRHNLVYWRDGEWLGLGAGAHSHLQGMRFAGVKSPAAYIRSVRGTEPGVGDGATPHSTLLPWITSVERPSPELAMADAAIMTLRLSEGLSLSGFEQRFGVPFEDVYRAVLPELFELGLLERAGGRLRIPPHRRLLASEAFARLMP
jgi:oxygen-independent coproporphyrinogen III oxidase